MARWHRMIALAVVGGAVLAGCSARPAAGRPTNGRAVVPSARSTPTKAALERAAFELVNRHRRARGLPALALDARITREARLHSDDMAAGRTPLGHEGFDERARALRRVIPWPATAENVAYDRGHRDPAAEAVRGWLASRGHRRNIEGPYELTGVGVASNAAGEVYFTQIFVGR